MFEISVKTSFPAAHRLPEYQGSCSRLHGHNWDVEVFLRGSRTNEIGLLIDFKKVKAAVRKILDKLDHQDLNSLAMFADQNPTSENLAKYIYCELSSKLNSACCHVHRVLVSETPGTTASYWESSEQETYD